MSEYGEIEASEGHGGLAEAHAESGSEEGYDSQYGILATEHQSIEHTEFENVKHIEYTDAAGNHYEVTEYTRYEHTEIEQESTYAAYGQDGGAGVIYDLEEEGGSNFIAASADTSIVGIGADTLADRFENFIGNVLDGPYEINDRSA